MPRHGRFFLARYHLLGRLDKSLLEKVLRDPSSVESKSHHWTIVDFEVRNTRVGKRTFEYWTGFMSKFDPNAVDEVVDENQHRTVAHDVPNKQAAKSRFIIWPAESVISFGHIWNHIRESDFRNRFPEIVRRSCGEFFADIELDLITDIEKFAVRLSGLDQITELSVRVVPPNPLFGRFWKPLKEYLRDRRSQSLRITESSERDGGLNTSLPALARESAGTDEASKSTQSQVEHIPPVDAAILMAADGYGKGQVTGVVDSQRVVIKTSDSVIQIKLPQDPDPEEFAHQVFKMIGRMNRDRNLKHK